MVVGVAQVLLRIPNNHSLKGKRSIIRQIVERLKRQFNISIAEVESQDRWQLIHLGVSQVGIKADAVQASLNKILDFIEGMGLVEIVDMELEIIHFSTKRTFYGKLCSCF
ncbi:MAG: DUF503 domain-containing protein [Candidatus Desulfofervidaceae bacterium]|nr:DUF503 domain-containing protein [Candidatus Desulfofervidaceae bacterium]MDL1969526.1 DUF503 domain-containing protein [Candidatus Desulfofervidaceae bacterium]